MLPFILPAHQRKVRWQLVLDTSEPNLTKATRRPMRGGEVYDLKARSLVLLDLPRHVEAENGVGEPGSVARRARRNSAAVSESTP